MLQIEFAELGDMDFLIGNLKLAESQIKTKIDNKEVLIARKESQQVGYLIFDFLWGHIPFISFVNVLPEYQREGIGKSLLRFLEEHLSKDSTVLFSSSMENAISAQAWHKKMGFVDSGIIYKINEDKSAEVFFRKQLIVSERNSYGLT